LRGRVEKVIVKRVAKERKHIWGKLAELSTFGSGDVASASQEAAQLRLEVDTEMARLDAA
jgi:hypothetical protein